MYEKHQQNVHIQIYTASLLPSLKTFSFRNDINETIIFAQNELNITNMQNEDTTCVTIISNNLNL